MGHNLTNSTPTHQNPVDTESVELIIEEQRRDYDYLLHIYNRLRATENVLLTAAFGVIAYLYYSSGEGTIAERLSIPPEGYGQIFYFVAVGFFLFGTIKLMLTVFGPNPWDTAYETSKRDYYATHLENLLYIKGRYDQCYEGNSKAYSKRKDDLKFLFFCIFISAIILIVIKTLK